MKKLVLLTASILLCAGFLHAHPTGTSKIAIRLLNTDSITVVVDANPEEIANSIHTFSYPKTQQADLLYRQQLSGYLQSHVRLHVNNLPEDLKVLRWKTNGNGPDDGFLNDSIAFHDGSRGIILAGALPRQPEKLTVEVQLFAELGIVPISEISLYWHDTVLVRQWLGLDRTLRLNISQDSLAAMLQRTRQPAEVRNARQESLIVRFITLGYTHILPEGLDHILFALGLFFFSAFMRPLLWQITAFTVAHSITLGLAMAGIFTLSPKIVDPLIALSIAVVAVENIFFRRVKASRWLIVFGFGLIHGMGFATALRGLTLPAGKFWQVLASFNIGVELGQLTVVAGAFLLTRWMWHKPWYFKRVVVPVSSAISLVAVFWFVQRITGF